MAEGYSMRPKWIVCVAIGAIVLSGLPLLDAGGDKVFTLAAKKGLLIKGNIAANDAKHRFVPVPQQNEVTLPGKLLRVKLLAGKRYRIAMTSRGVDSVLVIKDGADKQLAWDDDGAGGLNSLVMFDPPKDGTYKVFTLALKGTGPFNLQIREALVHEVGTGLAFKGSLGQARPPSFAYNVKFTAGKTYAIDMISPDEKALDPYLLLLDPSSKKIAEDDDGGNGLNARIVYRAAKTGTYRIVCTSFERSGAVRTR